MTCIAVIPARGGSRRIPRKNIKAFYGKPIIAYSIEAAWKSKLFDEVFVSTEDAEIAEIAKQYAASIIDREPAMAENDVGTRSVVQNALDHIDVKYGYMADEDYICCIYATAPLMSVTDLNRGYIAIKNNVDKSHAISIGYPPLQDAAQFYWSSVLSLRMGVDYFEDDTAIVRIDSERVCDINIPEDWDRAERMYTALQERK